MMKVSEYLKSVHSASTTDHINPALLVLAQEMRSSYRAMIPSAGTPDPVHIVEDIAIPSDEPNRTIPARLYKPFNTKNTQKLPMIVFIHGGGFVSGDLDTHDVLARAICNGAQAIVVAVDYRLAPEHPFPAGLEDVYNTLQWLVKQADSLNGDINRIAVAGDSAGGNLSAALTLLARDMGEFKLVAQWLMYPAVSSDMDTTSWQTYGNTYFPTKPVYIGVTQAYVPSGLSPAVPLAAPLWATHKNLPPALLQVGEFDPLRDEGLLYVEALKKAGVTAQALVYPAEQHGFIQFYKDKSQHVKGEEALHVGLAFLNHHLNP